MPHDWARRGAEGAGRRGAELRARRAPRERAVRPLRRHAQPGVRRHRGRDAGVRRGGAATARQIVLYQGKVATTFFYSSSGGQTAAIQDVWDSPPVPYLVSVPDPYDTISPYHDWGPVAFTAATVAKKLKLAGPILDLQPAVDGSERVSSVARRDAGGLAQSVGGSDAAHRARAALHLVLRSGRSRCPARGERPLRERGDADRPRARRDGAGARVEGRRRSVAAGAGARSGGGWRVLRSPSSRTRSPSTASPPARRSAPPCASRSPRS